MRGLLARALILAVPMLVCTAGCNHCSRTKQPFVVPFDSAPQPVPGPFGAPLPKGTNQIPDPPVPPKPIESKLFDPGSVDPTWKPGNSPGVKLYPPDVEESSQKEPEAVLKPKLPPPIVEAGPQPK